VLVGAYVSGQKVNTQVTASAVGKYMLLPSPAQDQYAGVFLFDVVSELSPGHGPDIPVSDEQ